MTTTIRTIRPAAPAQRQSFATLLRKPSTCAIRRPKTQRRAAPSGSAVVKWHDCPMSAAGLWSPAFTMPLSFIVQWNGLMGSSQLCHSVPLPQNANQVLCQSRPHSNNGVRGVFSSRVFSDVQVCVTNEEWRRGCGRRGGSSHLLHTRLPDYTPYFTPSSAKPGCQPGEQPDVRAGSVVSTEWTKVADVFERRSGGKNRSPLKITTVFVERCTRSTVEMEGWETGFRLEKHLAQSPLITEM